MAAKTTLLKRCIVAQSHSRHTASLIFLHGSGDTGEGVRAWVKDVLGTGKDLVFPHVRITYPSAPARPYTAMKSHMSTVWFDRKRIDNKSPEDDDSIMTSAELLGELINSEVREGIPKHRIIVGGFSMGGTMALHLGYRLHRDLAGVFAFSSFLNENSYVYQKLKENPGISPPLLQCHGTEDPLVLPAWGKATQKELKKLGVSCQYHVFKHMFHEMNKEEILLLKDFIEKYLPE
ncbi:lysophospholipase-like protein 1 [Saccoglossus kowalevskii]|uniref:palmitoyl-protein hydrolase n=1 Tax=Saccoglossus kowalevskii TaxID=10224 RepID=A0ABM0GM61_SACKO|nr:PREDICTED: lysophospholipase-like protein 1-like [Saccoglossus kowalevskii]